MMPDGTPHPQDFARVMHCLCKMNAHEQNKTGIQEFEFQKWPV